jgi:hypothetical protein
LLSLFSATEKNIFCYLDLARKEAKNKQTISKLEKQQTKERKQNAKIYQT